MVSYLCPMSAVTLQDVGHQDYSQLPVILPSAIRFLVFFVAIVPLYCYRNRNFPCWFLDVSSVSLALHLIHTLPMAFQRFDNRITLFMLFF